MQNDSKVLNGLAKFAKFFIKNYQVSLLFLVLLICGGLFSFNNLPRQGMPEIKIPYVLINTVYPGATAEQVEQEVTNKIENALGSVDGIKEVGSESAVSISSIFVEFDAATDLDQALDDLRREVDSIADLPEDVETPMVSDIDAEGPDLVFNLVAQGVGNLNDYADIYKEELNKVEGVEKVDVWGGAQQEVFISLNLEEMNERGVSYDQVKLALQGADLNMPGGKLEQEDDDLAIQILAENKTLDDLKDIVVAYQPFIGETKLNDIAEVQKQNIQEEDVYRTAYRDGDEMVTSSTLAVLVYAKADHDVVEVVEAVKIRLGELDKEERFPKELQSIMIYDMGREVNMLLGDLFTNAWQGLLIILVVLFIFISFRSSIVAAFIIPLVLLTAFLSFTFVDLSLNFLTLYALILSLGIVIDNAIVIVEGVQRKIREGLNKTEAAIQAIQDLGPALIAATATTVLVFVPMMFISGITGQFIKYIPYTVVITLISSIIIAFSITPFLSKVILRKHQTVKGKKKKQAAKVTDKCILGFCFLVKKLLSNKYSIIAALVIVGLLIAGSGITASKLKVEIWPAIDDAEYFQLTVKFPKNSSQDYKKEKIKSFTDEVVELYDKNSKIQENVVSYSPFTFAFEGAISDSAVYLVNLVEKDDLTVKNPELIEIFQEKLDDFEGAEVKVGAMEQGPPAAEYPVEIQITDQDLAILETSALEVAAYLEDLEGVKAVDNGVDGEKKPQVSIELDKEKIAEAGLVPFQVAALVANVYNPQDVGDFRDQENDKTLDIKLGFEREQSIDELKKLKIGTEELQNLAEIKEVDVLKSINHFDEKRFIELKASLEKDVQAVTINQQVEEHFNTEKLEAMDLDTDAITFRGDMESEEQAFDDFGMMMMISLLAIFALLAFQFKSFAQPFIIMLAIPLAIIGVFPALYLTNSPISFMVMLGFVVLMGIVVNNSIILIDRLNKLRKNTKMELRDVIAEGINQRTRPIIATTLTTIAGILPLTLTEYYWQGMGTTIIAGLITSAIFVLIIVPIVYYLYIAIIVKAKQKMKRNED